MNQTNYKPTINHWRCIAIERHQIIGLRLDVTDVIWSIHTAYWFILDRAVKRFMPSRLSERFFIFLRRWIPKNPLWWRVWPNQFIFAIHNDRYFDCNLFTMAARACVRKFFCLVTFIFRPYQDSVGDKTCSTKDFECQHVGIPFTIFHSAFKLEGCCHDNYPVNNRKNVIRRQAIIERKEFFWARGPRGGDANGSYLGRGWLYNFFLRSCCE